ncbi:MAG: protein translocase subunit SecF [Thermomicrobiales bacterium]|nr:MAG: protein translocase subunit SecF [Thermomicrobiales bacterium]
MEHLATYRKWWYLLSIIIILPGLVSLIFNGLDLGIDFTGGTIWEIQFDRTVSTEEVKNVLSEYGVTDSVVQTSSEDGGTDNVAIIRMEEMATPSELKTQLTAALTDTIGPFTELQISTVGSSVSDQVATRSILAIAVASIGILAYIAFAFRNTQRPLHYGAAAIIGMLHDVLLVLGVFSILGWLFGVQVDALFVTAILTIIGFSVHDTIVVFDRIRENLARQSDPTFEGIVNYSLAQTIVRSVNTSLTVVFTLLALFLFGGESTRTFVLALLIGVISGTYSSIFNASQLLVSWEYHDLRRWRESRKHKTATVAPSR